MSIPLRVLFVEDMEEDAVLMVRELKRGGFDPTWERVDDEQALLAALQAQRWDIVISDYSMPMFSGVEALKLVKADNDQTPFIIVSGVIGEQTAVEVMKAGAQDYFLKSAIARLPHAVDRELRDAPPHLRRRQRPLVRVRHRELVHRRGTRRARRHRGAQHRTVPVVQRVERSGEDHRLVRPGRDADGGAGAAGRVELHDVAVTHFVVFSL